ncbi:hypothetical protein G647_08688 [Cladophialophora carrionii CBS 160.54]|uniref:Uncharacterized protein n=1 Tax=Cladophialophora carrionii CBS 160.54 TaxID=1279043 RepID=V9CYE7_9EURO|nr:uncharacterized protein G647_08688 [Cladophialophora carrionii CBS 160.54]ETI19675.1 hypothetical protein G647_08688 [Cladophialophora carrionii CBS 160.54]
MSFGGEIVNASGHVDQPPRQYGLLSICGLALTVDNAWVVLGTSLAISVYNGGAPGSLPLEACITGDSISEGPRWGRPVGFFAGSLNYFGWPFDLASIAYIMSELVVQMYVLYYPDHVIKAWNLFVGLNCPTRNETSQRPSSPKSASASSTHGSSPSRCSTGVNDLSAVQTSIGSFPLAEAFAQATGSQGATFGLLFIVFLALVPCLIGTFLTVGRAWWALSRDNATPFSGFFSRVNEHLSCTVEATLLTGILTIGVCAITLGSKTAVNDLAGSFVVLSSISYAATILPHMLTQRKYIPLGPFNLGRFGYLINGLAVGFIIFFDIIYCFPFSLPTTASTMNYNSAILVGVVVLTTFWWFVRAVRKYDEPDVAKMVEVNMSQARRASRV